MEPDHVHQAMQSSIDERSAHQLAAILSSEYEQQNLQAFILAARFSSFKAAAQQLRITPGAVSKRIAQLESKLGFPLFYRLTRSIRLTSEGEIIADAYKKAHSNFCKDILNNLHIQTASITVYSHPSVMHNWLLRRLHDFRFKHPGISIHILTGNSPVDFEKQSRVDIALYYAHKCIEGAESMSFMNELSVPVCTPSYKQALLTKNSEPQLAFCDLLHDSAAWHFSPLELEWANWAKFHNQDISAARSVMSFDTSMASTQAALLNIGVAMGRYQLIRDELKAKKLIPLFPPHMYLFNPCAYWLSWPRVHALKPAVHTFMDWIIEEGAVCSRELINTWGLEV